MILALNKHFTTAQTLFIVYSIYSMNYSCWFFLISFLYVVFSSVQMDFFGISINLFNYVVSQSIVIFWFQKMSSNKIYLFIEAKKTQNYSFVIWPLFLLFLFVWFAKLTQRKCVHIKLYFLFTQNIFIYQRQSNTFTRSY